MQHAQLQADAITLQSIADAYVPSGDALPVRTVTATLAVLLQAARTLQPKTVSVVVDCLQNLISMGVVNGAAHTAPDPDHTLAYLRRTASLSPSNDASTSNNATTSATSEATTTTTTTTTTSPHASPPPPVPVSLPDAAVCTILACHTVGTEEVELQVLRTLLYVGSAPNLIPHGAALLAVIKSLFAVFLGSKSPVNVGAARAALVQIVNVAFRRMESGSLIVPTTPVTVRDHLAGVQALIERASGASGSGSGSGVGVGGSAGSPSPGGGGLGGNSEWAAPVPETTTMASMFGWMAGGSRTVELKVASYAESLLRECIHAHYEDEENQVRGSTSPSTATATTTTTTTTTSSSTGKVDTRTEEVVSTATASTSSPDPPASASTAAAAAMSSSSSLTSTLSSLTPTAQTCYFRSDAYAIYRSLTALAGRGAETGGQLDTSAVRAKVLALELTALVLANAQETLLTDGAFMRVTQRELFFALLKNVSGTVSEAVRLACSIFLALMLHFRRSLKAEIGIFFPMVLLRSLEAAAAGAAAGTVGVVGSTISKHHASTSSSSSSSTSAAAAGPVHVVASSSSPGALSFYHLAIVLRSLKVVCENGQLLVDLFANYDCDLQAPNLYERTIRGLVALAAKDDATPATFSDLRRTATQDAHIRSEALQCLVHVQESLLRWYSARSLVLEVVSTPAHGVEITATADERPPPDVEHHSPTSTDTSASPSSDTSNTTSTLQVWDVKGGEGSAGGEGPMKSTTTSAALEAQRRVKGVFEEGARLFNMGKTVKGIERLQSEGFIGASAADVARFLHANTNGALDKTEIGNYMGELDDAWYEALVSLDDS